MNKINFSPLPFGTYSGEHMGVYKITFDDKYFYIGGSATLRHRFGHWKHHIKRGTVRSKVIKSLIPNCTNILFEVVEFVYDINNVKPREDFYIKYNWDNPLLLNKCPSAYNNKGVILNPNKVIKVKGEATKKVQVAKFGKNGELLRIYGSINEAAKDLRVDPHRVTDRFKGIGKTVKGFVLKRIDDNMEVVNPIKRVHKGKGKKLTESQKNSIKRSMNKLFLLNPEKFTKGLPPKAIIMFDINDKVIKSFNSITIAAKEVKTTSGNICSVLKGMRKTAKGYKFKYAS